MENSGQTIREFETMDDVLRASLNSILRFGSDVSPRNRETRELIGWVFRLTQPRARKIHFKARRWSESLAIGELCWHLSGSDDLHFITYYSPVWASFSDDGEHIRGSCYGKRIFAGSKQSMSQWDFVKKTLREDPASRRAILTLYPAESSLRKLKLDQPCLTTIQFLIREGKLHCITTMRSNDVIWGLCYDVYFVTMLQELLALELGVSLGWYQHVANSIHIYKPFVKMARKIVTEKLPENPKPMPPMTTISGLSKFLSAEASLRNRKKDALNAVQTLAPYWRNLAKPLVEKHLASKKSL